MKDRDYYRQLQKDCRAALKPKMLWQTSFITAPQFVGPIHLPARAVSTGKGTYRRKDHGELRG